MLLVIFFNLSDHQISEVLFCYQDWKNHSYSSAEIRDQVSGQQDQFLTFVKWCLRHWVIFQVTVLKSGMVLWLVQQIRMNIRARRWLKDWHILMTGEVRWDCLANKRENSFLGAGISLTSLCTCLTAVQIWAAELPWLCHPEGWDCLSDHVAISPFPSRVHSLSLITSLRPSHTLPLLCP